MTATITTVRDLADRIRTHARQLTEPSTQPLLRDDGRTTRHPAASLLDQLTAEITPSGNRGGSTGHTRSGAPVAIDALDLHRRIKAETAGWCWTLTEQPPGPTLPERVRSIARAAGQLTDTDLMRNVDWFAADWVSSIRTLLNPPRRMTIAAACPACGVRVVYRRDETGEPVRRHTLDVDGVRGCTCLACDTHWPPEQLEHLARVIGCEPLD